MDEARIIARTKAARLRQQAGGQRMSRAEKQSRPRKCSKLKAIGATSNSRAARTCLKTRCVQLAAQPKGASYEWKMLSFFCQYLINNTSLTSLISAQEKIDSGAQYQKMFLLDYMPIEEDLMEV